MKLQTVHITHFRSLLDVTIHCASMHALIGANNAGKSNILHALDFLFNPSAQKINENTFHNRDVNAEIRVEATFIDLTAQEQEAFKGYLCPGNSFQFARTAKWGGDGAEIGQCYNKPQPVCDWLNPEKINGEAIKVWCKEELAINGQSFSTFLNGDVKVGTWKAKAAEFSAAHLKPADYAEVWSPNPQGFSGVLKGNLPHYELIPAVRDVADEAKVAKTNPFGRLIYSIVKQLQPELKKGLEDQFEETAKRLNRTAGNDRIAGIAAAEEKLRSLLREMMDVDLELEFEPPTVEAILTSPTLWVNDGFRGPVTYKGNGLQRAVILAILRAYAELATTRAEGNRRTLILAIEEPEAYLHPPMVRSVRTLLRQISDAGDQVFFTTHNPLLVDVAYFDEIIRVQSQSADKGSAVWQLPMSAMIEDILARRPNLAGKVTATTMREHYGHAYTATRSEGFFASKVILVEGLTEQYCLPIYAKAMKYDFDKLGIVVVECGTKDQIDRLYRIFNELAIPCYVLFDFDKGGKAEQKSAELLRLFGKDGAQAANRAAIELTVAYFEKDWEAALIPEVPDYERLAAAAHEMLGSGSKPLTARFIATALTQQQPPVIPPTIASIIEAAMKVKHVKSCLKKAAAA